MTQNQVANAAGISPRAIRELEAGRSNPALATMVAIVDSLNLTIDELVEAARSDPPRPDVTRAADLGTGATPLVRTLTEPLMNSRIVRQADPAGTVPHPGNAVFYHVLEGGIAAEVDGEVIKLRRGDSLHVNAGVEGHWRPDDRNSKVLVVAAADGIGGASQNRRSR